MPTVLLYWFCFAPLLLFIGLIIYGIYYNKNSLRSINKFVCKIENRNITILKGIKLQYWETSGYRAYISPNNNCDIYLLENSIVLVRRQNFVLNVHFRPLALTTDVYRLNSEFPDLNIYKPIKIYFKEAIKSQIYIIVPSSLSRHYRIEITLKDLTEEHVKALEFIRDWNI